MSVNYHTALEHFPPKAIAFWLWMFRPRLIQFPEVDIHQFKGIRWPPKELHYGPGLSKEALLYYSLLFSVLLLPWFVFPALYIAFPTEGETLFHLFFFGTIIGISWVDTLIVPSKKSSPKLIVSHSGILLAKTGEFLWEHLEELEIYKLRFKHYVQLRLSDGTLVKHRLRRRYKLLQGGTGMKWKDPLLTLSTYWQLVREKGGKPLITESIKVVNKRPLGDKRDVQRPRTNSVFYAPKSRNSHPHRHHLTNRRSGGHNRR